MSAYLERGKGGGVIDHHFHQFFRYITTTRPNGRGNIGQSKPWPLARTKFSPRNWLRIFFFFKCRNCIHLIVPGGGGGGHQARAPLKLEKISFFGVKSWFFTRNIPTIFAPPSAIGKNKIFWRKIVIFHTKYPKHFRSSLRNWKK